MGLVSLLQESSQMFSGFFYPLIQRLGSSIPTLIQAAHTIPLLTPLLVLLGGFLALWGISSWVFGKGAKLAPLRPSISPSVFGTNPRLKSGRRAVVVGGGISGVG